MSGRQVSPCGTVNAYQRHLRHGETPCEACTQAQRAYQRAWREKNSELVKTYQTAYRAEHREQRKEEVRAWRARTTEQAAAYRLRKSHGLTPNGLDAMRIAQDGRCYLCHEPLAETDMTIDHDHRCCRAKFSCTACRRGIACNRCNRLIGEVGDDPALLRRIADGLETAIAATDARIAAAGQMALPYESASPGPQHRKALSAPAREGKRRAGSGA